MIENLPIDKKIILFDGVCNFCNDSVLKVIKNDKNNVFVFTSLQSDTGKKIIEHIGIDINIIDSIILYQPNVAYYIKSSAALNIIKEFSGFWGLMQLFWIFPEPIRNVVYDYIAKNRYKWFGKKENCMIPTPKLKAKFLE